MIFAGIPTAVAPSGMLLITTAPAPIFTLSPIVISPIIVAFAPMYQFLPIFGAFVFLISSRYPIVTPCCIYVPSPIFTLELITMPKPEWQNHTPLKFTEYGISQ